MRDKIREIWNRIDDYIDTSNALIFGPMFSMAIWYQLILRGLPEEVIRDNLHAGVDAFGVLAGMGLLLKRSGWMKLVGVFFLFVSIMNTMLMLHSYIRFR
jgi:hypothetical protein